MIVKRKGNFSPLAGVRSLSYNAFFLVFSKIAEKGIRFVYLLLLARWLAPDMLGLYNYGVAWYLIFLTLACWGLGELLSIHLGRNTPNAEEIVGASLLVRIFMTLVFGCCCLWIGIVSNNDPVSRSVVSMFVIALVARSLAMWGRACFVAVELSHYSAGLEIGFRLLEVFCGAAYLFSGGVNVFALVTIHSACWVVEGGVALGFVRSRLSFRKIIVPWPFVKRSATEAFPMAVNVFLLMTLLQSGFVVLKHLSMDANALGFYTVAFQLVVNTVFIPEAFGQAALPILSRANSRRSDEQIVFLEAMLKICLFFSAVLVLVVIVYRSVIIRLLFGAEYLIASDALLICSLAMIAYYALPFANEVLRAGFKYGLATVNIGVALFVNIIVTVLLVPTMGEKAPAMGLLVGACIALILHLIVIHRKIARIAWWYAVLKPFLCAIFAIAVAWNMKALGVFGLATGLVILGACYAALGIFTPREKGYFAQILPWIGHRQA